MKKENINNYYTDKDLINLRLNIIDINFRVFFNYIKMEYKSCKSGKIVF